MPNDIDKTSPHYKGEFGSIYEVNQKFPNGGVAGDYVEIDGWAHYWNADRGTWCVNAQRDSYWDELITGIINKLKLFKGATYMGVADVSTIPEKIAGVKMYYFAKAAGTYSGFGGLQLAQGINVLYTDNGTSWTATPLLEVAQELGVSTEKVMSQKAVNTALDKKADKAAMDVELGKKADKAAMDVELDKKADKAAMDVELGKKADKAAMNVELGKKADKAAMDVELGKKADKAAMDVELGKKADKAAVNASLDLKANKSDVAKTNAVQDAEISRKANQQDVERSLCILRKEIGERTVVEGNVNNNPDEEDLTSKMGSNNREVLSLKDREYNPLEFSGKGYKILRKNIQEVTCAITKIQVTKAPTTDGYVSIIINGVETHVDLVASTDNTVALVAKKIADKLSETMDEYATSVNGALVTCTRRFGGDVTSSSFSGVSTGSEATVSESSKTELRNLITADMLNQPNTTYELRYNFDLNGAKISMPQKSTLKFTGGLLSNGTLIGNNTRVIADENEQIFKFSRNVHYIGGTWRIHKWCCAWFGTVPDGRAYRAKYNDAGELEKTYENNHFEVLIEGTDNYEPIQEALDAAYNTNIKFVELGVGSYRIAKPLNIGWGQYHAIRFKGVKSGHFGDITELNDVSTFILCDTGTYGICINSGYYVRISDFDILGWNGINYRKSITGWQNTTYYVENPEDWNTERVNRLPNHGLNPMSPYAGIVTDAFFNYDEAVNPYELPKPPANIEKLVARNSTALTVERVTSTGFCVGFGLEVGAAQTNADFYKFYNCDFGRNVYGFSTGSNQARNTALHECNVGDCYTAITNTKVGKRNGGLYGHISNCWFDSCYKILEWKPDVTPVVFYNCYCENAFMIGGSTAIGSPLENSIKFVDCNFKFTSNLNNPLGLPTYYFYGAGEFIRTSIAVTNDGILVPLFMGSGNLDNCSITTSGPKKGGAFYFNKEILFNPYIGKFTRVSEVMYTATNENRINQYTNTVGTSASSIIQISRNWVYADLKNISYSYNESTRILTLTSRWIKGNKANEGIICVGDIMFQMYTDTIYVIVKITPSEDNTATILCTPIQGFRKVNNKYICKEIKENRQWWIFSTRFKAFANPLIIKSVNGKEITLKNWDNNLKAGIVLSKVHDYEHSFQFLSGLIESVDISQKKITLKYSDQIDDTFKVINGYMLAEEDAKFWENTWVQDFIDAQKE